MDENPHKRVKKVPEVSLHWSALVLAAGYGTRLTRDINQDSSDQFKSLIGIPKALLPVAGVPLLDYWVRDIRSCKDVIIDDIFVVTNHVFYDQFVAWSQTRGIPTENIIDDGSNNNDNRLGAAGDIALAIETFRSKIGTNGIIIIAGDTLFYENDFNLNTFLSSLSTSFSGVVYYNLKDENETKKRGIIEVDQCNRVVNLLEKPDPSQTVSRKACPAFYAYQSNLFDDILRFYRESLSLPLDERDAPGKLLAWLVNQPQHSIMASEIIGRFDIGNLSEYKSTLDHFSLQLSTKLATLPKQVKDLCYARVGLMGNPSDGYQGKTLSFLIENFHAEVSITESARVQLIPHPFFDPFQFDNLDRLQSTTLSNGYYGGLRLLQATCKTFSSICFSRGIFFHTQRGFQIRYDTDIPRLVGLSGSSALVVAAFRCLMKYFGLTLVDLGIDPNEFPQIILNIEKEELGISAGLQDRVIQTFGGLVHMDFSSEKPKYSKLEPSLLPRMYLAYNTHTGGESGKVHSTVKERWISREPELVQGMKMLGRYADEAQECLRTRNFHRLVELFDLNFSTRRRLYSDEVVGKKNIEVAQVASGLGLAVKFTGSGGAYVCIRRDAFDAWFDSDREEATRRAFRDHGFEFVRISIPSS